jgi:hypothetical protein
MVISYLDDSIHYLGAGAGGVIRVELLSTGFSDITLQLYSFY